MSRSRTCEELCLYASLFLQSGFSDFSLIISAQLSAPPRAANSPKHSVLRACGCSRNEALLLAIEQQGKRVTFVRRGSRWLWPPKYRGSRGRYDTLLEDATERSATAAHRPSHWLELSQFGAEPSRPCVRSSAQVQNGPQKPSPRIQESS